MDGQDRCTQLEGSRPLVASLVVLILLIKWNVEPHVPRGRTTSDPPAWNTSEPVEAYGWPAVVMSRHGMIPNYPDDAKVVGWLPNQWYLWEILPNICVAMFWIAL